MPGGIERALVQTSAGYLHARMLGEGPAIGIFHINAQSSALMVPLVEALATRGFRAVALDYPSHGCSDAVDEQPSISDYARWALEALDQLAPGPVTVLGEATGSFVAAEVAGLAPARVASAILVNCPFRIKGESYPDRVPVTPELRPADATGFPVVRSLEFILEVDPAHSPMHPTQDWLDLLNTAQIEAGRRRWQAINALMSHDIEAAVSRVACPTLVLTGDHFYLAGKEGLLLERIPGSQGRTLPDTRFCATWERASEIADHAASFLGQLTA